MKVGHHYFSNIWSSIWKTSKLMDNKSLVIPYSFTVSEDFDALLKCPDEHGVVVDFSRSSGVPTMFFVVERLPMKTYSSHTSAASCKVMTSNGMIGWLFIENPMLDSLDRSGRWEYNKYLVREVKEEDVGKLPCYIDSK
jgi:hypothetical protein